MYLVFDIGGTTTRMAVSHTGESVDDVRLFPTNHNFSEALVQMLSISEELSHGEHYQKVVGGVRAYDRVSGTLFDQPNFPMWVGEPVLQRMKEAWGEVYLDNDAVMVGLGEAVYGAGKGSGIVAYITLSTGVGGCRIIHGKADPTVYSFEPGNMLVPNGESAGEHLENLVSGTAIQRKYGVKPTELVDEKAWGEIEDILAIGLNNVAVMWSPDVIVLGGSVPQRLNFDNVRRKLAEVCKIYPTVPRVEMATIDEQGGLYGALAYIKTLF